MKHEKAVWYSAQHVGSMPRVVEISAVYVNRRPNGAPRLVLYFVDPCAKLEVAPADSPALFAAFGPYLMDWIGAQAEIKMTHGRQWPWTGGTVPEYLPPITDPHKARYGTFRITPIIDAETAPMEGPQA